MYPGLIKKHNGAIISLYYYYLLTILIIIRMRGKKQIIAAENFILSTDQTYARILPLFLPLYFPSDKYSR